MSSPATPPFTCSHCKHEATLACAGCIATPDNPSGIVQTTWYCGASCQKAGWNNHKETCKAIQARKSLFRAGEIVQHIFYMYREKVFDKFVLNIERNGDHIKTSIRYASNQEKFFVAFPEEVCVDQADKQALLSCWACADALAYMHGLVKSLVRGLCKEVSDVTVSTKNHRRRFINVDIPAPYDNDNTKYGHEVIQVTLKNNDKYALDIAGAQYGQFNIVIPWDVYVQSHVEDILRYNDFGATHERITSPIYCNGNTDIQLKKNFNKLLSESMDDKIKEWQEANITLPAMLKLAEQAPFQKRNEFYAFLDGELDKAKLSIQGKFSGRARGRATDALLEQWLRKGTSRRGV